MEEDIQMPSFSCLYKEHALAMDSVYSYEERYSWKMQDLVLGINATD